MRIQKIRLRNWKNFKDAEASLGQRVFVIGPNASGKSNFLDAFRFLRDVAAFGLVHAVDDVRGGVSAIRCLSARRYSAIDVEVQVEIDQVDWTYRLVLTQDNRKRPSIKEERVGRDGVAVLSRPDDNDKLDPLRLTQTSLEQISANVDFRPLAEFFRSISYQHLLPQVVRDPRGFSPTPIQDDPFGRDFLSRLWQTSKQVRQSRLGKIVKALQIAVPQLVDLKPEVDDAGTPHLIGAYSHWRPNEARQSESQFSDGTLRLLGLLWSVFEGSGPLLLEEPEISLHPEVVRLLPAMFAKINRQRKESRQFVISTHSREMLSDPGIAPEEVLWLEPSPEGTVMRGPQTEDVAAMNAGLTAADVMLPKAAPKELNQLVLQFD